MKNIQIALYAILALCVLMGPCDSEAQQRDNVFVERLWKSVKYEEAYLHAYDSVAIARQGLQRYFTFYNQRRPHASLGGRTPDMVYFAALPQSKAA